MVKTVVVLSSIVLYSVQLSAQYGEGQVEVFVDTTVPFDTAWYRHLWDSLPESPISSETENVKDDSNYLSEEIIYPWYSGDSNILSTTTYTIIVTEPNPCVDPALSQPPAELTPLKIDFSEARSYPWYTSSSWELSCFLMPYPPLLQNPHNIDLLDQDTTHAASTISSFSETNARQITSSPPPAIPDPPKPAPVPEQPWYQAVLPNPIRVRKF